MPEGSQKGAKGSQKGAKRSQRRAKGTKGEPKDDQNALANLCPKKGAKKGTSRIYFLHNFGAILGAKNLKNHCTNNGFEAFWKIYKNIEKRNSLGANFGRYWSILEPIFKIRGSQNPPFRASAIAGYLQIHLPNEI